MTFIFYLMGSYIWLPDKNTGTAISKYLEILADHPECDSQLFANAVQRLSNKWFLILDVNHQINTFYHEELIHGEI